MKTPEQRPIQTLEISAKRPFNERYLAFNIGDEETSLTVRELILDISDKAYKAPKNQDKRLVDAYKVKHAQLAGLNSILEYSLGKNTLERQAAMFPGSPDFLLEAIGNHVKNEFVADIQRIQAQRRVAAMHNAPIPPSLRNKPSS